jgi:SulP family sulfate permease
LAPFSALRARWAEGYTRRDLRADVLAGAVVGLVAVPLSMALAIASGAPPQHGLYTAVVAGFLTPLFGGSRFQVTGPTAAFVVILAPISAKFGLPGLLLAGLMAGGLLVLMGLARLGQLIRFIPYPVTTGFTAGIGIVIATLQIKDFLGLRVAALPEHYVDKVETMARALGTASPWEFGLGLFTLACLLLWPKVNKKIPAPLVALSAATGVAVWVEGRVPGVAFQTIGRRFSSTVDGAVVHGVPGILPSFHFPWDWPTPTGEAVSVSLHYVQALLPAAFAIAALGAIESLLSAVVADGITQTRHDPDAELVALGQANIVGALFGGIPATGAIARTATNIRFGAVSPLAAMTHAVFIGVVLLAGAPLLSWLPMASLAALLLIVAYNMSEIRHVRHIVRVGPTGDVLVLLTCLLLTVLFDMVIGVSAGIVLAALMMLRNMAELTRGGARTEHPAAAAAPKGVLVYEIAGPLFFGAVENAVDALRAIGSDVKVVVFRLDEVPAMDVTGLVALDSAIRSLRRDGKKVLLVGARPQPLKLFRKAALLGPHTGVESLPRMEDALARAKDLSGTSAPTAR